MEEEFYDEIFADSDDEDNNKAPTTASKPSAATALAEVDNLFDSDEEDNEPSTVKKAPVNTDALFDSDDDDNRSSSPIKSKKLGKRKRKEKGKDKQITKKKNQRLQSGSKQSNEKSNGEKDSSDEYDSGDDVMASKEDLEFIDNYDDHADLVKEYDEENQIFDDERPQKKLSGKKSGANRERSGVDSGPLGDDPLSQVLKDLKNPRIKEWTDTEKQAFVEKLETRMMIAIRDDNYAILQKIPATNKLSLLPSVEQALFMKNLWNTFLDKGILLVIRDWIKPRKDGTLTSLPVRSTMYRILNILPCQIDHLKRSGPAMDGRFSHWDDLAPEDADDIQQQQAAKTTSTANDYLPIGHYIAQLRKHKLETDENKRLLKEIMEKWSRDVFSKSTDVRASFGALKHDPEVQAAIAQRYAMDPDANKYIYDSKRNAEFLRARAPVIVGHMFTISPQSIEGGHSMRGVDNSGSGGGSSSGSNNDKMVDGRTRLLKRTEIGGRSGGGGKSVGIKFNPRAETVSISKPNRDF
jgi:hypothetical protein